MKVKQTIIVAAAYFAGCAGFLLPAGAATARAPYAIAQAPTPVPTTRAQNDARMLMCDRYELAYRRLRQSHTDVGNSLKDFAASDLEHEKLAAVETQLNDALMLIQDRAARNCPDFRV